MATWQYGFKVVPRRQLLMKDGKAPLALTDAERESLPTWDLGTLREPLYTLIESRLPRCKSWSESIEIWGEDDKTCIELFKEKDGTVELSVRLDLRHLEREIIDMLQKVTSLLGALVIGEDGKIFTLNHEELKQQLQTSSAFKFVSNPQKFFSDLEHKNKKSQN